MKQIPYWFQLLSKPGIKLSELVTGFNVSRHEKDAPDESDERFFRSVKDDVSEYFDAPQRLRFPSAISSTQALRQHDRADYQHVDFRIQLHAARLIEALRRKDCPFYVHSAFRTRDEQEALFNKGTTKARWPRAPHCQGAALDIVHGHYHWELSRSEWAFVGKLGKDLHYRLMQATPEKLRYGITWGGDWRFYDPAHWELTAWRDNIQHFKTGDPVRLTPRAILNKSARL